MLPFDLIFAGIDKLSFTVDIAEHRRALFDESLLRATEGYGKQTVDPSNQWYRHNIRLPDLGNLLISSAPMRNSARYARFDFNPNRVTRFPHLVMILRKLLGSQYNSLICKAIFTRIDFNFDYVADKNNYVFVDSQRFRKSGVFTYLGTQSKSGDLGTINLGSRHGTKVSFYNKLVEQLVRVANGSLDPSQQLYFDCPPDQFIFRIEVSLRPRKSFAELQVDIGHIFDHISIFSLPKSDLFFPFFVAHCSLYGIKESFELLTRLDALEGKQVRKVFEQYKYSLDSTAMNSSINQSLAEFLQVMNLPINKPRNFSTIRLDA